MTAVVVALGLVVALLGALTVGLLRTHAEVLRALHELGVGLDDTRTASGPAPVRAPTIRTRPGVPAPGVDRTGFVNEPLVGTTPGGSAAAVSLAPRPHSTVLAFLSTGCTTCAHFWSVLDDEVDLPVQPAEIVIVTRGPEAEAPAEVARLAPARVLTLQSTEVWNRFGVPGSPYFALVDGTSGQVVGEGSATTWDHVTGLLRRALADAEVGLAGGDVTGGGHHDAQH